jgi:hypothetical protein
MPMMKEHKFIDADDAATAGGLSALLILLLICLYGWMQNRDIDIDELTRCPAPGRGQQLVGRGHFEIDGEPGELQCVYVTAPAYKQVAMAE